MSATLLKSVLDADQDFEWYPTTEKMVDAVARRIPKDESCSLMDIGAGDGRVLTGIASRLKDRVRLYAIEKSSVLMQAQPDEIIPVGTDLFEQNLACLPVDFIFCNPPYSQFEGWASLVIESGHAKKAFLILPQRWKESKQIADAITKRGVTTTVIHNDSFHDAERRARAVIDIVQINYPRENNYRETPQDPFDAWFDQNINTFDAEKEVSAEDIQSELARMNKLSTIGEMVEAYNEEHKRMEDNYRAIFKLDYALLRELGVEKDAVREGIKKKMAGLKAKYWQVLFERLDTITSRLSTATKQSFLEKLTGRQSIEFTSSNAYAVVLWSIKNANKYFDEQLVKLFRDLSTHEGVSNYKSNQKTWEKNQWRYMAEDHSHYALDYRIVLDHYAAIGKDSYGFEHTGNLHRSCHELIDDVIAVLGNLGFTVRDVAPRSRTWSGGEWQDFYASDDRALFQIKAFKNGNLHFRFMPDAIRVLNVEAGRLLGWLQNPGDVVAQLGYSPDEAASYFRRSQKISISNVKLLESYNAGA